MRVFSMTDCEVDSLVLVFPDEEWLESLTRSEVPLEDSLTVETRELAATSEPRLVRP